MENFTIPRWFHDLDELDRRSEWIGQGLCGSVVKCNDQGHSFAVKIYPALDDSEDEEDSETYYQQEAKANKVLSSREELNYLIPRCYDARVPDQHDQPVLVFEFIEGQGLWEIESSDPIPFMRQVEDELRTTVKMIHEAGIAHGDIRPENVIIRSSPIQVIDESGDQDERENAKKESEEASTNNSSTTRKLETNTCVLIDFSHARTHEHKDFRREKGRDWGELEWTLEQTRARLFTPAALQCLKLGISTPEARKEFIDLLEHSSTIDTFLSRELEDFTSPIEELSYAVARYHARSGSLGETRQVFANFKALNPTFNDFKWTLILAEACGVHRGRASCQFLEDLLEKNNAASVLNLEEAYVIRRKLVAYKSQDDIPAALALMCRLLLDVWQLKESESVPDQCITSVSSLSGSTGAVSVTKWKEWLEDLTLRLKFLMSKRFICRFPGYMRPDKWSMDQSRKFWHASQKAIDAGDYRPPAAKITALANKLNVSDSKQLCDMQETSISTEPNQAATADVDANQEAKTDMEAKQEAKTDTEAKSTDLAQQRHALGSIDANSRPLAKRKSIDGDLEVPESKKLKLLNDAGEVEREVTKKLQCEDEQLRSPRSGTAM